MMLFIETESESLSPDYKYMTIVMLIITLCIVGLFYSHYEKNKNNENNIEQEKREQINENILHR